MRQATQQIRQPRDIIDLWPTISEFASDIGLKHYQSGYRMRERNSINKRHWEKIVEAGKRRGVSVSFKDLAVAHARAIAPDAAE